MVSSLTCELAEVSLSIISRPIPGWGMTYGPPGEGPFPGVMVLHGSEGAWSGYSYLNAAILAAHGFLAFPFGYSIGGNLWRLLSGSGVVDLSSRLVGHLV